MVNGPSRSICLASIAFVASLLLAPAAQADAVLDICLDAGDAIETCECASEKLLEAIGAEDFAAYERAGEIYLAGMAQGKVRSDAWDEALGAERLDLSASNALSKAHFEAMKACRP